MKFRRRSHRRQRGHRITQIMARDGESCAICAVPLDRHLRDFQHPDYITFDHITPRSAGGLDVVANLRLAHAACNWARGNDPVTLEEEAA